MDQFSECSTADNKLLGDDFASMEQPLDPQSEIPQRPSQHEIDNVFGFCKSVSCVVGQDGPMRVTEDHPWMFASAGNGYFIRAFECEHHFSARKGFDHLFILSQNAGPEGVRMHELVGDDPQFVASDRKSKQPAMDAEALRDAEGVFDELRDELREADGRCDFATIERVRTQMSRLAHDMGRCSRTRKPVDLNNHIEKLRPRIHGAIKTACGELESARPSMRQLAEHFRASVTSKGASFFYLPPPPSQPDWRFSFA